MSSGTVVAHTYDPDGNRVQTSVTPSGGTATITNMLVDTVGCASCGGGLSQVVAETDGTASLTALYVRAGDELLAVMRPAGGGAWTTRFVHQDWLGSVRALTDETGTTTDTRGYEAFGTKNVEAGNDTLTYGFAGEPFQAESSLAYHRARWMDARVGRFEGMDPLQGVPERPSTLHAYSYGDGDPIDTVDPTGLDADFGADFSIHVFGQTGPTGATAPQGTPPYASFDLAIYDGMMAALRLSSNSGNAQIGGEPPIPKSPLKKEVAGIVYKVFTPSAVSTGGSWGAQALLSDPPFPRMIRIPSWAYSIRTPIAERFALAKMSRIFLRSTSVARMLTLITWSSKRCSSIPVVGTN
jgi:RHS repeat-associated protein